MLCPSCGQKLHSGAASASVGQKVAKSAGKGILRLITGLIRLCVTLILLGLIGLFFWPVSSTGKGGQAEDAKRVRVVLDQVEKARGKQAVKVTLTEQQINSYLEEQVSVTTSEGPLQLETLNVDVGEQDVVFFTGTALGPAKITWELTLVPAPQKGSFPFEVKQARVGHLPLLGDALKDFAGKKISGLFADFDNEQKALESVTDLKVKEGAIALQAGP